MIEVDWLPVLVVETETGDPLPEERGIHAVERLRTGNPRRARVHHEAPLHTLYALGSRGHEGRRPRGPSHDRSGDTVAYRGEVSFDNE